MKATQHIKRISIETVCLLYALLFIYAAISKLLDFENFQVQLGQSPMLSAFAELVSYTVPAVEFIIAFMLLTVRLRYAGMYAAFSLMVMFTFYIYIILNYSSFTPCSCGGILESLSWNQHIVFNLFFVTLIVVGIFTIDTNARFFKSTQRKWVTLIITGLVSCAIVYLLFSWSERIMHYHNTFVRRFPHFPAVFAKEINLGSSNYYFAGADNDKIYLGNYSAPLQITEVSKEGTIEQHAVQLSRKNLPFTSIQIKVMPPYFFVVDGNVPTIFKGKMSDWLAKYTIKGKSYFSIIQPIDSTSLILRATLISSKTNTLGRINLNDTTKLSFAPELIQKQIDGVFDTDGQLHYDTFNKRIAYVYTYRNEYIVADSNLNLLHRGNTIDTVSQAKLDVVTVKSNGETKLASPPLIVNKSSALHKNLLFVNSQLAGQYESLEMWKKASIIDIYDINNKKYVFSFYIYDVGHKKLRNLYVQGNHLYALIDDKLILYKLRKSVTKNYKN